MSQHIQQQHHPQPHYVHYTPPTANPFTHVAPNDTQHQPQSQPQQLPQPQPQPTQPQPPQQQAAQGSSTSAPLVATGDWTKDLVHLAKTAELKCVFIYRSLTRCVLGIFINLTDPFDYCRPTCSAYRRTNYNFSSQKTCAYIATTHCSYLICSC